MAKKCPQCGGYLSKFAFNGCTCQKAKSTDSVIGAARAITDLFGRFDWVTPARELKHEITDDISNEFSIFVSRRDYPDVLATLKRIGVSPVRSPVGLGIERTYSVVIPYDKLSKVQDALNQDGVKWSIRA